MEEKKQAPAQVGIDVREVMVMEDYREPEETKARPGDPEQGKTGQGSFRQAKTGQGDPEQGKAGQRSFRQAKTEQGKARQGNSRQGKTGQEAFGQEKEQSEEAQQEARWEAVVEAVLFTMGQSVELRQLAAAIDQSEKTARQVTLRLKDRYDREQRGIQIIELDNCYQMCTRVEYYENLIRVAATPKKHVLTDVVLETLSIIAYKQPVTKLEIEKIRGVKSDHAVNRLVEYNLVQEVGRLDAPGRPALFATTEEFLRRFGIGSMEDLPDMNPVQAEEIRNEVEEELKLRMEEDDDIGSDVPAE